MIKQTEQIDLLVRVHNEAEWLPLLLRSIEKQVDVKINRILILDNRSADNPTGVVKFFDSLPIDVVEYDFPYRPGAMLNYGVDYLASRPDSAPLICIISAHCYFQANDSLRNLADALDDERGIRAAFGRQLPMSISDHNAIRDLALLYTGERRLISLAASFNNAFSIIYQKALREHPFDQNATNLEDVLWASAELRKGNKIVYEPLATVVHHHGPHQDGNHERLSNTVETIMSNQDAFQTQICFPDVCESDFNYVLFGCPTLGLREDLVSRARSKIVYILSEADAANFVTINDVEEVISLETKSDKPIYHYFKQVSEVLRQKKWNNLYYIIIDQNYDSSVPIVSPLLAKEAMQNTFCNSIWPVKSSTSIFFDEFGRRVESATSEALHEQKHYGFESTRGNGLIITNKALENSKIIFDQYQILDLGKV